MTGIPCRTDSVSLTSDRIRVVVHPSAGFLCSRLHLADEVEQVLWHKGIPRSVTGDLGPGGERSIQTFLDDFTGGWFAMIPTAGFPAGDSPNQYLHGTACRSDWTIEEQSSEHVVATATIPPGFRCRREIRVSQSAVHCRTAVRNESGRSQELSWGEHPCFRASASSDSIDVWPKQLFSYSRLVNDRVPSGHPIGTSRSAVGLVEGEAKGSRLVLSDWSKNPREHWGLTTREQKAVLHRPGRSCIELAWSSESLRHALIWMTESGNDPDEVLVAIEPTSTIRRGGGEPQEVLRIAPDDSIWAELTMTARSSCRHSREWASA